MKRIAVFIAALLLVIGVVQANPVPLNVPIPNHLEFAICHDGSYTEDSGHVVIFGEFPDETVITTASTGIPYKWPEGPIVPSMVTIPAQSLYWQQFTVRVSSEDKDGNLWPAGNYSGEVMFIMSGKAWPVDVRVWIQDCGDNPPHPYPVPEFPTALVSATIIVWFLGAVFLIRRTKEH